jgi:Domain of unknown function (DUF4124)
MKTTLLLILGLAVTNAYSVQMYQCEDETGNIQYTQTPSPNCVEVKPKPVQSISVPPSSTKVQAPTPTKPQTIDEGCKIAVDTLQKIADKIALIKPDKNDPEKRVILTKEEIEQERIKAQEYFDALCTEKKSTTENQPQQQSNETTTGSEPTPTKPQTIDEGCKISADTLQKIADRLALTKPDKNDPKKRVFLTKEEIEQERIKAQEYFDALCK